MRTVSFPASSRWVMLLCLGALIVMVPTLVLAQAQTTVSINSGGPANGSFVADQYYSGGSTYTNTRTIDMNQIPTSPLPPAAIFNTERYGAMTYTIPNRSGAQTVTLYFAETYATAVGQRLFNVSINGTVVLSSFDIYASAGGADRAIARTFSTTANASGQVVIQFTAITQNPKINGIAVAGGVNPTQVPPTGIPPTSVPPTSIPPSSISINAGGPVTGSFVADQYFSGGSTYTNTRTINMSQITTNPPPAAVFNTERYGVMAYTIPNRSGAQTVTLYFAETYVTAAGQRVFNVAVNGTTVLSSFDIYASAGGADRAIVRTFNTTANASGQVVIQFTAITQSPKINGITVTAGSPQPTNVPPTSVPPTNVPPTSVPPTNVPPTSVPPTNVPPTSVPPTNVPPTNVPPTNVPPTSVPPTSSPGGMTMMGADVSTLQRSQELGQKYYNASGAEQEPLVILKNLGVNTIRLRVWVSPASGYNNKARVVEYARQVKANGLKLLIDFHYSDTWADPGKQFKPAAWSSHNITQLQTDVYNHTYDVCSALKAQGTTPDSVQIGNEINQGMLWEDGRVINNNFTNLGLLLKQEYNAVKACNSSTQVLIHTADADSLTNARWFYDGIRNQGVNWDITALSYYCFWHGSLSNMTSVVRDMGSRYGKPVVIVETAYPFTTADADSEPNVISSPTPCSDYQATWAGQAGAFAAVQSAAKSGGAIGVFYWEPTWVAIAGNGWDPADINGTGDGWDNMAIFNWTGNVNPNVRWNP